MRPIGPAPFYMQHAHHGHPLAWLIVLIVLVAIVGFALYVLVKALRAGTGIQPALSGMQGGSSVDPALELVRARYAKGEIDRDEFLRVSTDLGAPPPAPAT